MDARHEDLNNLLKLQGIDRETLQVQKTFDNLPQRNKIVELRTKQKEIKDKQDSVDAMLSEAEAKVRKIMAEDDRLQDKAKATQQAIDEAKGDYRNLEKRTKELQGYAKRSEQLGYQLEEADAQLARVQNVATQITMALQQLEHEEHHVVEDFKKEGTSLQAKLADLKKQREAAAAELPAELLDAYTKTAARCGGVAVGVLEEGKCGVCRAAIDDTRMIEVRSKAPLSTCPHCKRLLIV